MSEKEPGPTLTFKAGDEVMFEVMQAHRTGKFCGAIFVNGQMMLIGPERESYAAAAEDVRFERAKFDEQVEHYAIDNDLYEQSARSKN